MPVIKIERKTDWSLRRANPDDREGIKSFYSQNIWKDKNAEAMYRWKYEGNRFGMTVTWVGVNSAGTIISNAIFLPWQFCLNGKRINAAQAADGVVKLEYRGQGLSLELFNSSMKDNMEKGASLCFAFPNEAGVMVHKKNNGLHLGSILRYTKPLTAKYLVNRYIKSNILSWIVSIIGNAILKLLSKDSYLLSPYRLIIGKVENCTNDFDDFWDRAAKKLHNKVITNKNCAYLNWKYLNSPNKNRKLYSVKKNGIICGFIVLEDTPKIGYVVDILAYDERTLTQLIAYAIKYFRKQGKDSVVFVALENNMYFKNFESFGFIKRPEQKHFYIYLSEEVEDKSFFADSKNWFITIGDCDIERL